jgi:hypothetical protein
MAKAAPAHPTPAISEDRKPWEYGHRNENGFLESPRAFFCFTEYYLPMGVSRSAAVAAKAAGSSPTTFQKYCARDDWAARAAAYDRHNAGTWRAEVDEEAKALYQTELRRFREDQQRRARTLGRVADLMIGATTRTLEAMEAEGGYVDPDQLATVARAAAAIVETSMNTAAAALGVTDVLEALEAQE